MPGTKGHRKHGNNKFRYKYQDAQGLEAETAANVALSPDEQDVVDSGKIQITETPEIQRFYARLEQTHKIQKERNR